MSKVKSTWHVIGLAIIILLTISITGFGQLPVQATRINEIEKDGSNNLLTYLPYQVIGQEDAGDEFTGEAAAWLIGLSLFPIAMDWIARIMIRSGFFGEKVKQFIRQKNTFLKKIFMPFHTYLSILAMVSGILHLIISSCEANPLPELGLILLVILVITGLLFKLKIIPTAVRTSLYKFHSSFIISGLFFVILYVGHAVMEID
jgi:hypothetical protein